MKKTIFSLFYVFISFQLAYADTVVLKTGRIIQTEKEFEENEEVKFCRNDSSLSYLVEKSRRIASEIEKEKSLSNVNIEQKNTNYAFPKKNEKVPYQYIVTTIRPGYKGDNVHEIFKMIKQLDNKLIKSDFETYDEFRNRFSNITNDTSHHIH